MKNLKIFVFCFIVLLPAVLSTANPKFNQAKAETSQTGSALLTIIIDDFGSYDQSGVESILSIDAPITCAVIPHIDYTEDNAKRAIATGKEVIVHMPMQAHVNIPLSWYGKEYIAANDNTKTVYDKLDRAFENVPGASGFNMHIGSGVCQNPNVLNSIYQYSIDKNTCFVDSRTHLNTVCDAVARDKDIIYLGRDEFLEPKGSKGYVTAKHHLMVGASLAKERGHAIVIGHVGIHGGETTAKAIKDSLSDINKMGVEIVPLSKLYNNLNASYVSKKQKDSEQKKVST